MRRVVLLIIVVLAIAGAGAWYWWSEVLPGPPATLAIVPGDDVIVGPTEELQLAADVRDARGRLISTPPTWTADVPIDATGRLTAPDKTGTYYIQAAIGTLQTTAKLTVKPGPPKTARVLPASAAVKPRDTVAFSVTAFDEWGNLVPVTPTWRVTVGAGAVDQQGIFAAGPAGTSTIAAEVEGITVTATATAQCVPPRTETAAGLTFTVVCGGSADVWLNGKGFDAASVTRTIDDAVSAVEANFHRTLGHRLNVNVFADKAGFDVGLKQLLRVEPTPFEEGVFIPPSIVAIDWSAPDVPEAIALHEITHLVVDEMVGRRVAIPFWLHEGLATVSEFEVSADTKLISRYCTASAAKIGRMPSLDSIATGAGWRAYVNDVGVIAYYYAAQVASFIAADTTSASGLLEKMAGGLPLPAAYAASSGRSFETFTAELADRSRALADGYPGVAVTNRDDGTSVYVAYGQPRGSRVSVTVENARFGGSQTMTANEYGCAMGFLGNNWPHGTYTVSVSGPAGRATTTLRR